MRFLRKLLGLLAPPADAPGGASYLSGDERLDTMPTYQRELRTRIYHPASGA